MFPFIDKIKKQGCDIEFAYARTATPESYSENRHFALALLKNRTDGCYYLKYYYFNHKHHHPSYEES